MEANSPPPPLALGWTEHTAPTGHKYYYNASTKHSTYTRPAPAVIPPPAPPAWNAQPVPQGFNGTYMSQPQFPTQPFFPQQQFPLSNYGNPYQHRSGPRDPRQDSRHLKDRPKKRHEIPGHTPWLLVTTKFRRRFVHNPETNKSLWKIPPDLLSSVLELDIQHLKKNEAQEKGGKRANEDYEKPITAEAPKLQGQMTAQNGKGDEEEEEEEEEEVEEIVEEEEEEEGGDETAVSATKAPEEEEQEYEFGEEDMAAQLAEMEEYGDEGEYEEGWDDDTGDQQMSEQEAIGAFKSLLEDIDANPFSTWDSILSNNPQVLEDERYMFLSTMKSRKDAFSQWSTDKIQRQKDDRAKQARQDPRIPYLAMLEKCANPKLYWPEFRRKFKKESEMKDPKLSDKEREKLYRDYINRITKMSRSTLETELAQLLKSITVSGSWNSTLAVASLESSTLPSELLGDIRWISMKRKDRFAILKDYLKGLPDAASAAKANDAHESPNTGSIDDKARQARHERERQVEESRRRQQQELRRGQKRLREEEAELEKATQFGRERLRETL